MLRSVGHEVEVCDARSRPLLVPRYQAVIVGGSVHASRYERELRDWVRSHADELDVWPNAFFSVSLAAANGEEAHATEMQQVIDRFCSATAWRPMHVVTFAGAFGVLGVQPAAAAAHEVDRPPGGARPVHGYCARLRPDRLRTGRGLRT